MSTATKPNVDVKTRLTPRYKVIGHNDDVTPMDFVVQVFVEIFKKSEYDAIQVMIEDGHPVRVANVIEQDINLTSPVDLLRANMVHARRSDPALRIASNVQIHSSAQVYNSVVGCGVEIVEPISIFNSLLFPRTKVTSKVSLDRVIITPQGVIDCRPFIEVSELTGSLAASATA